MNHAVTNWGKTFLRDTNAGLRSISQAASMGVQGDLMSNERWGRECMLQLQEDENWTKPTATTWAAEFLLRGGESREILGSWIRSGKVPEAKKRSATRRCIAAPHPLLPSGSQCLLCDCAHARS